MGLNYVKSGVNGLYYMQSISYGDALFTKTQQRVLSLLYGKPDKRFFTNEIVRWADMGRGTVRRELERMTSANLLTSYKEGNQLYFSANTSNPIFNELLNIVRKTFGIADVIRAALIPIQENIEIAFVYGSLAKQTDSQSSDIDLMIIGQQLEYSKVMALLVTIEESLDRPINPTLYNTGDFRVKWQAGNSFINRVMAQDKLMVKGIINDLK